MLVITRKVGQEIRIGDDIVINVIGIDRFRNQIRLGITAPRAVLVHRQEVYAAIQNEKKAAKGKL